MIYIPRFGLGGLKIGTARRLEEEPGINLEDKPRATTNNDLIHQYSGQHP